MIDPFARAEQWRSRAAELRMLAGGAQAREARARLLAIAGGLDQHARALERRALYLHSAAPIFREHHTETVGEAAD